MLPILLMIAFIAFFIYIGNENQKNLLSEKFEEKKQEVAMMAYQMDNILKMENDWQSRHSYYQTTLIYNMELLNRSNWTYAAVFDSKLNQLSRQVNYDGGFDPLSYPDFKTSIQTSEIGDKLYHFDPTVGPARDVYLHYRWIPTGGEYSDRFLVVVAISKYSIVTQTSTWYQLGAIALTVTTTILNLIIIVALTRLADERKKYQMNEREVK